MLGLRLRVVLIVQQVGLKLGVFLLLPFSAGVASEQHLVFVDSPPGISLLLPYVNPECFSLFHSLQNEIKIQLGWGHWLLLVGRNDDVLIFFYLATLLKHLLFVIGFFFVCGGEICIWPDMGWQWHLGCDTSMVIYKLT